jgi:type VI secretion system protein ImpH
MANTLRSKADFLSTLRRLLARPDGRSAARRLSRHQWRPLRRLLLREDADAILDIILVQARAQQRHQPRSPEPWTLVQAIEALNREDVHAGLFGALRLLQGAQRDRARIGYARLAEEEPVRLDQGLLLGLTHQEVDGIEPLRPDRASGRPVVKQWAVGLMGPQGPLPLAWTQHAHDMAYAAHRSARDTSMIAFFNVLQRRQLSFLYRAWSDTQAITGVDWEAAGHPLADRLRAVAGVAHIEQTHHDSIDQDFKLAFSAVLSRRVKSPQPLAAMLARYFGCEVRVEEFCTRWLDIPQDQRTRLGWRFSQLGRDAVAGARVWDSATRFRIRVGPVELSKYEDFLPHGAAHRQLHDLVALYAGPEWEWELVLVLQQVEVPALRLTSGDGAGNGIRLGWTSWLGVRCGFLDADDFRMNMAPRLGTRPARLTSMH